MTTEENRARGKKARRDGQAFERKVRADLEKNGWIVSRWQNNVDLEVNRMIAAKQSIFRITSTGFPDFIIFKKHQGDYIVKGVECKTNGYLSREEKEKIKWLIENRIFEKILIAKKDKDGDIAYEE
jgi:hypothetical protein